jgi:type IV pilus assembly protein PilE
MNNRGFSLIELMIAVAVAGIIAAVAYPSYVSYVVRGKRTECRAALLQTMQQQERYYTQQNTYVAYTTASVNLKTFSGDSLETSACSISSGQCTSTVALSVCVAVNGTPRYTDPEVGVIKLQSDGTKSCSGTDQTKCWK